MCQTYSCTIHILKKENSIVVSCFYCEFVIVMHDSRTKLCCKLLAEKLSVSETRSYENA